VERELQPGHPAESDDSDLSPFLCQLILLIPSQNNSKPRLSCSIGSADIE
jgi:hypothetical protein